MNRLAPSKVLTDAIFQIDQTQEDLMNDLPRWKDEKDADFKCMVESHVQFYESTMREELLKKTLKFEQTVNELTQFLNLNSVDQLLGTINILVEFSGLHTEFAQKVIEAKRIKMEMEE